jgi:hypothetical protein
VDVMIPVVAHVRRRRRHGHNYSSRIRARR